MNTIIKTNQLKENRGITLISLVITILILTILATLIISVMREDKIVNHTKNMQNEFNELQSTENSKFENYKDSLKSEFQR